MNNKNNNYDPWTQGDAEGDKAVLNSSKVDKDTQEKAFRLLDFYSVAVKALEGGASREQIVGKLLDLGMAENEAEKLSDSVVSSSVERPVNYLKYAVFPLATFLISFIAWTIFFSKEYLDVFLKVDSLVFLLFLVIYSVTVKFKGKLGVYSRYYVTLILFYSTSLLSGLLFLKGSWEEVNLATLGNPVYLVFKAIFSAINYIGPLWVGGILIVLSALMLLGSSIEKSRIKSKVF